MSDYDTKVAVLDAVDNIYYRKGRTDLGHAINYTIENSLTKNAGARDGVGKVCYNTYL